MKFENLKNARVVRSSWLEEGGRRLDCNPYMSGAQEARDALKILKVSKDRLDEVSTDIFDSGRESRNWVSDPAYGVRFMGTSAISLAELSTLPLISKRQVARNPRLLLQQSCSLITRSGTIGRMAYVRSDMAGMTCSEDVLRVVPDVSKISPGYLYAYLSSKYGLPLVVSGTYGAIIQHIEPEHIAGLPVPRFGNDFELKISELIDQAAVQRVLASKKRRAAIDHFHQLLGWVNLRGDSLARSVSVTHVQRRMDAFYHSARVAHSIKALASCSSVRLGDLVERVFEPNRGSRLKVDDAKFGVPFLSSSEVFEINPQGEYLISRSRTPHIETLLLSPRDVLLPRSGQVGGIIGRAVLPLTGNIGNAASEHLVRVRCHSTDDAAYIWAILASDPGYWSVVGTAFGTSIPSLDAALVADIQIPWFSQQDRKHIAALAQEAVKAQGLGIQYETEAVSMVENKIAEGA